MGILTDASKLSEDLHHDSVHQAVSPLRNREHDAPATHNESLLRKDGLSDFMELRVNPVVVSAIGMQLLKDPESLVLVIPLDKLAGRFREPCLFVGNQKLTLANNHSSTYRSGQWLEDQLGLPGKLKETSIGNYYYPARAPSRSRPRSR